MVTSFYILSTVRDFRYRECPGHERRKEWCELFRNIMYVLFNKMKWCLPLYEAVCFVQSISSELFAWMHVLYNTNPVYSAFEKLAVLCAYDLRSL
jgi:hypothetical protein